MTDEKKKPEDEINDEQLDEVAGGLTEPVIGSISDGVLKPKVQIDLSGVGDKFEGQYYVDDVGHTYDTDE